MSIENSIWQESTPTCKHLRSKQYYMDFSEHASGMDSGVTVPCWCLKTMKPVGPDSLSVTKDECTPERECFEQDGG
jgi:hypothetical protein